MPDHDIAAPAAAAHSSRPPDLPPRPTLGIVVPVRNEAANIAPLTQELAAHAPHGTSVLFVDDSPDDATVQAIHQVKDLWAPQLQIAVLHRAPGDRADGLCGAVTLGIARSTSDLVLVMDGDLQHPPSTIPALLVRARSHELVVASRYCRGGSASGLSGPVRHAVSRASTWCARALFPHPLRGVTDPMTGFFLLRRDSVDPDRLGGAGFKILLELLIAHPELSRAEVPLRFAARRHGTSKGDFGQGVHYLRQLVRLRAGVTAPVPAAAELAA